MSFYQVMKYVKDGNKMKRPENCHDIMFDLMSDCWHILPDERPTFLQICKRLEGKANDRWRATCFFLTPEGKEAVVNQEEMLQVCGIKDYLKDKELKVSAFCCLINNSPPTKLEIVSISSSLLLIFSGFTTVSLKTFLYHKTLLCLILLAREVI